MSHSGTSDEDISAATCMNRPSLSAAFGDKRAFYPKVHAHDWQLSFADMT
jgi:hypothetical protein